MYGKSNLSELFQVQHVEGVFGTVSPIFPVYDN
jgi:hypothetical protein